jgi:hypothetical protein
MRARAPALPVLGCLRLLSLSLIAVTSVLVSSVSSQVPAVQHGAVVLEFSHQGFSPGFGNILAIETVRIYESRLCVRESEYPERSKNGQWRKVTTKEEKQLDATELAELVEWANEAEFLNANSIYTGKMRIDSWDHLTIVYRGKGLEKKVEVRNYYALLPIDRPRVPESFKKLAKWAFPYSFQE